MQQSLAFNIIKIVLVMVLLTVFGWVIMRYSHIAHAVSAAPTISLVGVISLYGLSHVFRMVRLALLTLDQRKQILPLVTMHAVTAFPSSFFPFKIGEVLRLIGLFALFDNKHKALAIWLVERFGDISVISLFILLLYLFDVAIPQALGYVFILFISVSVLSLLAFYATAKMLLFLNRYLVLSSSTARGLRILRASHQLRHLEATIIASLEGRFFAMLLTSVAIWACEILAVVAFIRSVSTSLNEITTYFISILSGNVPPVLSGVIETFTINKSVTLAAMAVVFSLITLVVLQLRRANS
ncbi:lysylphosphatidylglycerol synthase domain-containing protein [Saccharophagus degradans]|uniref:Lysylphosphatidylglycerol synthase domain-containing protein n=1 Tax=Saccharophagus degradans TaxID=86304 RepID=A0AAW7X7E3_9GAMM|nr:lysylphosphatidylglycerol synthase domain-containing protein [Saccharophagus degradans]MDO6423505.1 lysylphosphatidylglycerol synthase domain-containing protein [Saccharophagus degradans]MDO6606910.1 lysylphosphatidylglycerol synthase domain-containing protein [Saccharophagus degradans]